MVTCNAFNAPPQVIDCERFTLVGPAGLEPATRWDEGLAWGRRFGDFLKRRPNSLSMASTSVQQFHAVA